MYYVMPLSLQASPVRPRLPYFKVNSFGTMRMNMVMTLRNDPLTTLDHAQNAAKKRKFLRDNAYCKYKDASDVVVRANEQLTRDQLEIQQAQYHQFKSGIEKWKKKVLEVAAKILIAAIGKQRNLPYLMTDIWAQ